eukprot:15335075-Ditylum_brightwellii.AAC.2
MPLKGQSWVYPLTCLMKSRVPSARLKSSAKYGPSSLATKLVHSRLGAVPAHMGLQSGFSLGCSGHVLLISVNQTAAVSSYMHVGWTLLANKRR